MSSLVSNICPDCHLFLNKNPVFTSFRQIGVHCIELGLIWQRNRGMFCTELSQMIFKHSSNHDCGWLKIPLVEKMLRLINQFRKHLSSHQTPNIGKVTSVKIVTQCL